MPLSPVNLVSEAVPVGIWLRIDLDAEPIVGSLEVPGEAAALTFVGWIGLTAALELLRTRQSTEVGTELREDR